MTPATVSRARPQPEALAALTAQLRNDYGDRALTAQAVREQHSHGEGLSDAGLPDIVVFPHSNEEVAAIVRGCHAARIPVIAFGVGTSLEGHVAALEILLEPPPLHAGEVSDQAVQGQGRRRHGSPRRRPIRPAHAVV